MSTFSLPSYPHADIPSYTARPRGDEQTLGLTGRRVANITPLGNWTKKVGHATLTLVDQILNSELPTYGRNASIHGFVTLDSTEDVASVRLKLDGRVKCKTIAEIGRSDVTLLKITVPLWTRGDSNSHCPDMLPFGVPLQTMFTWNGRTNPLPPTFEYTFYDLQGGTPGLMAKIKYEIAVEVEHTHLSLKDRLTATLSTPFIYLPRTRPGRPSTTNPTSVFEAVMEHRVGGKHRELDPIVWKLCLPPPGTYAISQWIPFSVSVTSRSSAFLEPFAPVNKKERASIRVYILRQISIKVNTIDLWRSYVIAEGSLTYQPHANDGMWLNNVPSSLTGAKLSNLGGGGSRTSLSDREGWVSLNWSGELKIDGDQTTVGGFEVGDMKVKDFFVLSVVPPNPQAGNLLEVKRVVPIQLTTDSWEGGLAPLSAKAMDYHAEADLESNDYLEGRGDGHHVEASPQNGANGYRYNHDGHETNGNGEYHNGHEGMPPYHA